MREKNKTNTKETVKVIILLILVILVAGIVLSTKGKDQLELDFNFNFSNDEEFSYEISPSDYNNEYRNTKRNGAYAMVGANSDGSYRIYFIESISAVKNVLVKLDSVKISDDKVIFKNQHDIELALTFVSPEEFRVQPSAGDGSIVVGAGDALLEGTYRAIKELSVFSLSEFEY